MILYLVTCGTTGQRTPSAFFARRLVRPVASATDDFTRLPITDKYDICIVDS